MYAVILLYQIQIQQKFVEDVPNDLHLEHVLKKKYTITIIRRNFVIKIKVVVLGGLKPKEDETCILGFQDIYPHG